MRDSIGNCSDDSRTVLATEDNFRSARMAVIAITACLRLTTLSVKESEDGPKGSSRNQNWAGLIERMTVECPPRYLELIVVVICFLVRAARLQLRLSLPGPKSFVSSELINGNKSAQSTRGCGPEHGSNQSLFGRTSLAGGLCLPGETYVQSCSGIAGLPFYLPESCCEGEDNEVGSVVSVGSGGGTGGVVHVYGFVRFIWNHSAMGYVSFV